MTFPATAIEIMLASPGDVKAERVAARRVISQWNAEHSRDTHIVLLTMGWESHSASDVSGRRAQAQINDRLVAHADLMIGIFWTRLGSPTGRSPSGTVEEIKLQHKRKKPLMLFFSDAPVAPSLLLEDQYQEVKRLKTWAYTQGLVGSYESQEAFPEVFRQALNIMLKSDERMKTLAVDTLTPPANQLLSIQAIDLLKRIGAAPKGQVVVQKDSSGVRFTDGSVVLVQATNTVEILKWRAAFDELLSGGYLVDKTRRNQLFELTPKASEIFQP